MCQYKWQCLFYSNTQIRHKHTFQCLSGGIVVFVFIGGLEGIVFFAFFPLKTLKHLKHVVGEKEIGWYFFLFFDNRNEFIWPFKGWKVNKRFITFCFRLCPLCCFDRNIQQYLLSPGCVVPNEPIKE